MNFYFYIIQDVLTKKYYGGSKTGIDSDPKQLLNFEHKKPYFTSSLVVKEMLKEAKHRFIIRKIKLFSSKEETLKYETRFLKRVKVTKNDRWLNNNYSFPIIPNSWKNKTEEQRKVHSENISKGRKGIKFSETHRKKLSEWDRSNIDKNYVTEEWKNKKREKQKEIWEKRRNGELPNVNVNKSKRAWFIDENGNNKFSIDGDVPSSWKLGRPLNFNCIKFD